MNIFTRHSLLTLSLILVFQIHSSVIFSQKITVENKAAQEVKDYTLEIPVAGLNLSFGHYTATVNGQIVPVEIIKKTDGNDYAVIPVDKIGAKGKIDVSLQKGFASAYPKRTYAELSHKIGGHFEGHKYVGGYSWVKPNYITLPGSFRDHSYYIKYEGPGWESDKVAFRFYLDNRNAIDVFAKKTAGIVLPAVGVDGFDNYHNMADWGMDNLKVGKALGLGSIAVWDGEKAVRVEKKDSVTCLIAADGKVRSQVKTIYYGWDANGKKSDLTSLISIDAGSRASHMALSIDGEIDNIATGIIKSKNAELIVGKQAKGKWSYIATFGKQSLNNDMQGLVVFFPVDKVKEITEDALNHVVVLDAKDGFAEYYFMPTWELDNDPVATKEKLLECIDEVLLRLNNPLAYTIKKK
ncbi:DUF4861 family protein [Dysgonomonas sp. 511]|uniref:DUF4861 family protein n=1 Tax=Dysgonomonas sp. 511 TaxID=2302930 RepID=UPI0013D4C176|nr:DUF4861 family protein [Dysgonomonas sp. 511]